jgi:hypothetical protein
MARKKEVKEEGRVDASDCQHQNLREDGLKVVCNDCGQIING